MNSKMVIACLIAVAVGIALGIQAQKKNWLGLGT
jgi:ABC-type proline/glycine betaine transport system permease subunit